MSAGEWAAVVTPGELRRHPEALDLAALRSAPEFAAHAVRLGEQLGAAQYRRREELESDPARPGRRAREAPSPARALAGLLAVASPIVALGLVVSRAQLDVSAVAPWSASLLALGAALLTAAVVPVRATPPPPRDRLFFAVVAAAVGTVTLIAMLVRSDSAATVISPVWVVLGVASVLVAVVLVIAIQSARARAPRSAVAEGDRAAEDWSARVARELDIVAADSIAELQAEWNALEPAARDRIRRDLDDAVTELGRRRLVEDAGRAAQHLPGLLVLESHAIGLALDARLDPSLEGAPGR